jgi:signal transduction histidine kinase
MRLYLKNAIFSSVQIVNLVNDLLDLAKLEAASFVLNNESFNLVEVIAQTFSIVQFQAEQRGIHLQLILDEAKPFMFR